VKQVPLGWLYRLDTAKARKGIKEVTPLPWKWSPSLNQSSRLKEREGRADVLPFTHTAITARKMEGKK
jgi:hypothetical protein